MTDDRAVSVTLNYIILLGIATAMLVGMTMVVGSLVDSQVNHAVQDELTVTGESLATELEQADRLVRSADDPSTISITKDLPTHISQRSYRIEVNGSEDVITLSTTRPANEIRVSFNASTFADDSWDLRGGPVEIILVDGELEVREG